MPPPEIKPSQYVHLRGSDTVMTLVQAIGARYASERPDVGLPLVGGGTYHGYKCALDGSADLGMASSVMPPDIEVWARKQQRTCQPVTMAYDGLAAIVHPDNPVADVSRTDLRDIFSGRITHWKSLGWDAGGAIQVYSQDPQRGGYEAWKRLVLGPAHHITLSAQVINGSSLFRNVQEDRRGIGYVGLVAALKAKVKMLSVDGVFPNNEAIFSGAYFIRRELVLVARPDPPKKVQDFLAFCLAADKGQEIVKGLGVVPKTQARA